MQKESSLSKLVVQCVRMWWVPPVLEGQMYVKPFVSEDLCYWDFFKKLVAMYAIKEKKWFCLGIKVFWRGDYVWWWVFLKLIQIQRKRFDLF